MEDSIKALLQESLQEWADIERKEAELEKEKCSRGKKDQIIISKHCAENRLADMFHIADLLLKYDGMPKHDRDRVTTFKTKYPNDITAKELSEFLDVQDIYKNYLELGEENDD